MFGHSSTGIDQRAAFRPGRLRHDPSQVGSVETSNETIQHGAQYAQLH